MYGLLKTAVFATLLGAWIWFVAPLMLPMRAPDVVTFLRSEAVQELVTERLATQVVIERDYSTLLWGTDHFLAYGVVELLIGVNLAEMKVEKVGENYIIDHSADIYLIDGQGQLRDKIAHGTTSTAVAQAMRKLLKGNR